MTVNEMKQLSQNERINKIYNDMIEIQSYSRTIKWIDMKKTLSTKKVKPSQNTIKVCENIINANDPIYRIRNRNEFLNYLKSNFHGGCNDKLNTKYENVFHKIFPYLQKQCPFGTGKGGYKKYGVKRYIADFVDPLSKTIIEIDGNNHKDKLQIIKDKIRDIFFLEHGYVTVRFTNQEVLNLLMMICNAFTT